MLHGPPGPLNPARDAAPPDARTRAQDAVGELGDTEVTWIGHVAPVSEREGEPGAADELADGPGAAPAAGAELCDERGERVRLQGFEHGW